MLARRHLTVLSRRVAGGPAMLTEALGIDCAYDRTPLDSTIIWIEDRGVAVAQDHIVASARVGVDYAGPDASLPWRFRIKGNSWTSPAK